MTAEHYLKIVDNGNTLSHAIVELRDTNPKSPPLAIFYQNASRLNSPVTENQRYESLLHFLAGIEYLEVSNFGTNLEAPSIDTLFKKLIKTLEAGEKITFPSDVGRSFLENHNTFLELYLGCPVPRW